MVRGRDPSAVTVLIEDGAAVAGVVLATGCLGLTSYTGSPVFDAIGSVIIGGKLSNLSLRKPEKLCPGQDSKLNNGVKPKCVAVLATGAAA